MKPGINPMLSKLRIVLLLLVVAQTAAPRAEDKIASALLARTKVKVNKPTSDETLTRLVKFRSRVKNLQMQWTIERGAEIMRSFSGDIGGGRISATSHINWTFPDQPQSARVHLDSVDMRDLFHASNLEMEGHYSAILNGTLDFHWSGLRMHAIRGSLEGEAQLTTGQGYITGSSILDCIALASGIPDLRRLDFTDGQFEADVNNGRFFIRKFQLNGPLARLSADGTVDLDTQNMNVTLHISVPESLAQRSTSTAVSGALMLLGQVRSLREPGGFVRIPASPRFGGTLDKPQLVLDSAQ